MNESGLLHNIKHTHKRRCACIMRCGAVGGRTLPEPVSSSLWGVGSDPPSLARHPTPARSLSTLSSNSDSPSTKL